MRVFLAFLLGIVVAVGGAYLRDSAYAPPARPYVNWDVVSEAANGVADSARAQFDRLTKE